VFRKQILPTKNANDFFSVLEGKLGYIVNVAVTGMEK
jgi:hypothetical protein